MQSVPSHHRPFRRLPGAMAQCPRRLSSPAADCSAHRHRRGPLSRHQNPRYAGHPPMRGSPPWRHSCRRLDCQSTDKGYGLNQLRYDLRKLRGHGLIERDGSRYAYRLTTKGVQVALLFLFFHKRLCGPLANSRFHHTPDPQHRPNCQLEAAYHRADKAIEKIVDLLAAASPGGFKCRTAFVKHPSG